MSEYPITNFKGSVTVGVPKVLYKSTVVYITDCKFMVFTIHTCHCISIRPVFMCIYIYNQVFCELPPVSMGNSWNNSIEVFALAETLDGM